MREGRLGYNCENGRYGLLSMDLWIDTGFHCGECDHTVCNFRKCKWIPFVKNGCCNHHFIRMLHSGYIVQQEKTDGWSVDDSEDMCLHVDNCNGTSVVILDNRKK